MRLPANFLRCLATPGHWMMFAGAGVDHWRDGGGGALCFSAPSLDPALLLWVAQGCPGMLGGMALGLALDCAGPARRSLLSAAAAMGAGFIAMVQASALTGGMAGAGLAAMAAAMLISDALLDRLSLLHRGSGAPSQEAA